MNSAMLLLGSTLVLCIAAASGWQYNGYATYSNIYGGVCGIGTNKLQAVSMNAAQFGGGSACGQCVQIQGTGNGAGANPVSTTPFIAMINNVCPQCGWGDLELQSSGDGRWGIGWSFVNCYNGRKLMEASNDTVAANMTADATTSGPPTVGDMPSAKSGQVCENHMGCEKARKLMEASSDTVAANMTADANTSESPTGGIEASTYIACRSGFNSSGLRCGPTNG